MRHSTTQMNSDFWPASMGAIMPYFILLIFVFVAYSNIFDNAFLFDDNYLIKANTYLRSGSHFGDILTKATNSGAGLNGGFYRPAQILLYWFMYNLGDGSTFLFHLLNLSLHAANTCLVYQIGKKLGFNIWAVFLAALIWSVHPLHTEAVTYMSATADPLFAFFCMGAIVYLLPDITKRKIFKVIPIFLLGILSKETAVMFPLLVMTCLFLTRPQRLNIRTYFCTWPLWGISIIYVIWRLHATGFANSETFTGIYEGHGQIDMKQYSENVDYRIYTFLATLPTYLSLFVWPQGLHMERSFPVYMTPWSWPVMVGCGMVLVAAAQIIRSCRKNNHGIELSWGLLWFAAAHAPDSGILLPVNSLVLEHWMYLPSIGLFLGLSETLAKLMQNRQKIFGLICSIIILCIAVAMSVVTYVQNMVWADSASFFGNIIHYEERSWRAYGSLGLYYFNNKEFVNAIEQFKKMIEISDKDATIRYNLGMAYLSLPNQSAHLGEAAENFKRAIEINPNFYRPYKMLSEIYATLGDQQTAASYHARAEDLKNQK